VFSWASLLALFGSVADFFLGRQKQNAQITHDNEVRAAQREADALEAKNDAVEQVARVNGAIDRTGVWDAASDPHNRDN